MLRKAIHLSFSTQKHQVVFLRHGESIWNEENKFTGWTDVRLSAMGIKQAANAGKALSQNGYQFDICFTSVLTRAIQTFNYAADELNCHYIPVVKSWRLNERHYGALQGLNKSQTIEKHGKQLVEQWKRSYNVLPPPLQITDDRSAIHDRRYKNISPENIPMAESLKATKDRVLPFWQSDIIPAIKNGSRVLVIAHGNSLRAIVQQLSKISEEDISRLEIPKSIPLVYEVDDNIRAIKKFYLADPQQLEAQINKVKKQR